MSQDIEQIYDTALRELKQGRSKSEILSKYPEHSGQLEGLLDLSLALSALPKKIAPEPAMQRKYVFAPARRLWLHWLHFSRFATVSMSVLLLAALGISTGYAAYMSHPGDTFFGLKKAGEHAELAFTLNAQQKINLQVAIAQQRLDDAQLALNTPGSNDPQKQAAALSELAAETQNTIDALNQASTTAISQDQPLIASLQTITNKQQALLQNLTSKKTAAVNKSVLAAAQQTAGKVAAIQQYLTAAEGDQALTTLQSNPDAVIVTGAITQISYNTVSVNDKTFTLIGATIVKDAGGAVITAQNLKLKQTVQILGDQTDTILIARQISLVDQNGQVRDAETTNATSTGSNEQAAPTSTPAGGASQNQSALPDPNIATGGYIIEDPAPQTDYNH